MMQDFELIELEGVVAHCLARQRLGLLEREALAAVANLSDAARRALAGAGAPTAPTRSPRRASATRSAWPARCASARARSWRADSFFTSPTFAAWRWVFFDQWSDRAPGDLGDLDDAELRARALEEW